jgi:adenylate cyclase
LTRRGEFCILTGIWIPIGIRKEEAMAAKHTFVFMDLVGFTALSAERGDDGAADVALRFYEHVRELLSEHRAEEVKTIGDAMMIRCENPQLAICLGLRVVDDLDARGLPPVRVGVHTGTAVSRNGDWYGSAVNVAARLCSAAGGCEVLVSDATRDAAGSLKRVRLGDRQLHWLKNVAEPVAARPASLHECGGRLRARDMVGKLKRMRSVRPMQLTRQEVVG